jgi:hypothetical protein
MTAPSAYQLQQAMSDADGVTFLRYETRPVTYAVFRTGAGELRLSHGKTELRHLSMVGRGDACPETQKALAEWPNNKESDDV